MLELNNLPGPHASDIGGLFGYIRKVQLGNRTTDMLHHIKHQLPSESLTSLHRIPRKLRSQSIMAEKATYTFGHHTSVVSSHARRTAQDSAAFLLSHLKPHHTILDVGCGPGTITADLAQLVPDGKVTGVDAVESVLETARGHVEGRGIRNCVFEAVDANSLPYADASFDVVFCHQVLQHVNDQVGILKEMLRVAKPGGVVAAREVDYKSFAWYPEPAGLDQWLSWYRQVARQCGGEPDAGRYVQQVSDIKYTLKPC